MDGATAAPASRRPGLARRALRDGTRLQHERMHVHPRLRRLEDGSIGREDYGTLLLDFLRFHCTVEARLAQGPDPAPVGIELAAHRRSDQLRDDLAALGVPVPDPMAPVDGLAVPRSIAAALGYLYVTEGSRLGGRVLAKALDGILPAGCPAGRRFLSGDGLCGNRGWAAFCDVLDAAGDTPGRRVAMIESAQAAFAALEACLAVGRQ